MEAWRVWQKHFGRVDVSLEDLARDAERLGRVLERDTSGLTAPSRWTQSAVELRTIARDVAAHKARRAAAGPPASEQERIDALLAKGALDDRIRIRGLLVGTK